MPKITIQVDQDTKTWLEHRKQEVGIPEAETARRALREAMETDESFSAGKKKPQPRR